MDGVKAEGITSRTISKAKELATTFDIDEVYKDIDNLVKKCALDGLMILVSVNQIFDITKKMIPAQIPLFLEKPPGLMPGQTKTLVELAEKHGTKNMVGYNRRYYSIFHKGIELINQNGGLLGLAVEGHERFWKIARGDMPDEVRENWVYANSTHTIDLLRFFGGKIKSISSLSKSLKEKNGDQFVVSMEFESGTLGTYTSHWYSPGGWTAVLFSEGVTVKFEPLEKGVWIDTNLREYEIHPDEVDVKYKPGFYRQMEAFRKLVSNGKVEWPGQDLEEVYRTMRLAQQIACT
jgi:predicted dehydrogenase